jgi:hypothetical protein
MWAGRGGKKEGEKNVSTCATSNKKHHKNHDERGEHEREQLHIREG